MVILLYTFYTLETIIRLMDSATPCLGNVIDEGRSDRVEKLRLPVSGSVLATVAGNGGEETRLISTSCSLISTSRGRACKRCNYAVWLWNKREGYRKAKSGKPHKKCNVRYLARTGLEQKICEQRREIQNESVREKRALNEMIEFSESNCTDHGAY